MYALLDFGELRIEQRTEYSKVKSYYKGELVDGYESYYNKAYIDGINNFFQGIIKKDAFLNCKGLKNVEIPDSVTSIGQGAFSGCSGLTSIIIKNNVTNIEDNAFEYCSKLTNVEIGNNVTSIGANTFIRCMNLKSITIPDSVTSIGNNVFWGCIKLLNVTFKTTTGWYISFDKGKKATALNSSDLANTSTAAAYLKKIYNWEYWTHE